MAEFTLRTDFVELTGTVKTGWVELFNQGQPGPGTWHLVLELAAGDPLLVTADNKVNPFNWLACQITPVTPFRNEPKAGRLINEVIGKKVRLSGSWGDLSENNITRSTVILPIAWILVDQSSLSSATGDAFNVSPIIEEHGFTQVVRDVDLFAFTDDTPFNFGVMPPHHREDRHLEISIPFPFRPQTNSVPKFAECIDRDDFEQMMFGLRTVSTPAFPFHNDRQHNITISSEPSKDILQVTIDTGVVGAGQGFFYSKLVLTYDEAFEKMCNPDVCLSDPGRSCQATGEKRLTYVYPQMSSVLAGDLLLGPAGGGGVLGQLLGALDGPQFYDHMVVFTEDDGRTVRHCTASDDRIAKEAYYSHKVTVNTPFGSIEKKLPIAGIRHDIIKFAWPGSINQTIGEVCETGQNRSNPQFSFSTLYSEVINSEVANKPLLWQLSPAERSKRTAFHDPEAVGTVKRDPKHSDRGYFNLAKLQKDPAFRSEIDPITGREVGWIHPVLVKPHPFLAAAARDLLRTIAFSAKKISAHYRFFSYTNAGIVIDPAFNAPSLGSWGPNAGADWAADTKAAVCSSFIWAAVQDANQLLPGSGRPQVELEGEPDASDFRPRADQDGLYQYTSDERINAAKALFSFTHNKVAKEVDKAIEAIPGFVDTLLDVTGVSGAIDGAKEFLAGVVANQLCNTFASDTPNDLSSSWDSTGTGVAVSPDDTMLRWDVRAALDTPPPPISHGKLNVYGNFTQINIPQSGWRLVPIYRVQAVNGKGTVRGAVVRRVVSNEQATTVIGATVRFGCQTKETTLIEREVGFRFINTKAGRYHLQAFHFVVDPDTNVGLEWKSKLDEIDLRDGDDQSGIVLELFPPPGLARKVAVMSHHDIVDRVVVGKDRWGHFDLNGFVNLAFDPLDVNLAPPEQKNTKIEDRFDKLTPEVGSGVHVRVIVNARLNKVIAPDGSESFDGKVVCDATIVFFDTGEGEINDTIEVFGILLGLGDSHPIPYNMVSNDTVPERASGLLTITILSASLP